MKKILIATDGSETARAELMPGAPLVLILFLTQAVNAVLLLPLLILMIVLARDRSLLGEHCRDAPPDRLSGWPSPALWPPAPSGWLCSRFSRRPHPDSGAARMAPASCVDTLKP